MIPSSLLLCFTKVIIKLHASTSHSINLLLLLLMLFMIDKSEWYLQLIWLYRNNWNISLILVLACWLLLYKLEITLFSIQTARFYLVFTFNHSGVVRMSSKITKLDQISTVSFISIWRCHYQDLLRLLNYRRRFWQNEIFFSRVT